MSWLSGGCFLLSIFSLEVDTYPSLDTFIVCGRGGVGPGEGTWGLRGRTRMDRSVLKNQSTPARTKAAEALVATQTTSHSGVTRRSSLSTPTPPPLLLFPVSPGHHRRGYRGLS